MNRILLIPTACLLMAPWCAPVQGESPALEIDASEFSDLQEALDAVPKTGGVVVIPPGNLELTEPLRVSTPETRLVGSGAATHLINRNEEGEPAIILQPSDIEQNPKARLWRVQLADLRISGNPKSGDGLYAKFIEEIYLQGLSIDHNGGNGIHLVDCFEDPRVADSILTYNADCGIRISNCHDIVVNANHFEENRDGLHCADSFNLCMNANNLDDHLRHGVMIENTYGSVLSGNMIEECNGTAIILDRDCYGITLSANVIAHHLEGGIDLRDAWGCAVSANTFTIVHRFGVRVSGGSGRHSISANTFCNTWIGDKDKRPAKGKTPMSIDEGAGVLLETGARHVVVSSNSFSGLSTAAVWSTGDCRSVIVSDNLITDCGRKTGDQPWIDVTTAGPSSIKDNIEDRGEQSSQ